MNTAIAYRNESEGTAAIVGILYAEDFDELPSPPQDERGPADLVPTALTQADLDAACSAAVSAARLAWEADQQQRQADILATIAAAMATAREETEKVALAATEATVCTVLAMLAGALPRFCRDHGAAEVAALVHCVLPTLRTQSRVMIRVHPELVHDLKRNLDELEPDLADSITVAPAAMERGDVRVAWENGALMRDTKQILQAIQDALGQLGLHQPAETSSKRRLAHAE